ncbi:YbhB/YbcL family Raf kinase inhibitor-like protein [Candidatus Nitrosopumilus sp. SW]|uniref:YbhB/YbcL family Raf kinase inhibitor-like protein n=1 Tax=Candidatus Nitrosopumilus sp. SW TaxID=2508726 RepID=UPI0011548981|nr:YbhB/YbcL family Raf kinase inhibitor-like protein [Candidatus Nitrosopumilus sp. SW]QDI88844.1 YbhB/YbcL family Raf kinase inhibitor-like protein [Candidatus Nitrosopumilus sp. SW]
MKLESSSFKNGETIPKKFGYKNGNVSPSLIISDVPESTKSLALIMDDPDAMGAVGKVWVHWVLWNIPSDIKKIDENSIPENSIEGKTDFGEIGYGGPAPPDKEHTYVFKLYALDIMLELSKGSTKSDLENSIKDHIIAETKLTGRYSPQ